jgi:hypothetical protein
LASQPLREARGGKRTDVVAQSSHLCRAQRLQFPVWEQQGCLCDLCPAPELLRSWHVSNSLFHTFSLITSGSPPRSGGATCSHL